MSRPRAFRFKIFHYYLIPLVALVVWWGMLIAMLTAWSIQGRPIYWFMTETSRPVYLSDIAATNLQPLFISCAGFQAIFFVGTLICEYRLRRTGQLQKYTSTKQPKFAIAAIVCAIIGQLGILFVAIFNTRVHHTVHISMVGVFIAGCFLACFCNFFVSFIFGFYPGRLTPTHEHVIFGKNRWANLYMVSFMLKVFWLLGASTVAICFGVYMYLDIEGTSAIFEWTICFFYGFLLIMWSIDLFPASIKAYNKNQRIYEYDPYAKEHVNDYPDSFETPVQGIYETPQQGMHETPEQGLYQTPEQVRYNY